MSAFSMIESFFFLSLGITFVLIILLIYHFKQRITTIEQKSDTMFDIVQNLAKELNSMKAARPIYANAVLKERNALEEEDDEEESEDEDEDSEDEDEDEDSDDDDNDEDSEDDDEDETEVWEARVRDVATPAKLVPAYDNDERGGVRGALAPAKESVKIINISDLEQIDDIQDLDLDSESESEEPVELKDDESDKIKVLKMTANTTDPEPIITNPSNNIHVYKKMTVGSLKSLVISKGLCSDASKLSKRELLLLLTNK